MTISLYIAENGKVTGFVGPNGAGKSTTMKIIAALETADSGMATVDGTPFINAPFAPHALGIHLSGEALPASVSAKALLRHAARLAHAPEKRVTELLELVGIEDAQHKKVGTFSMGMKQRLGMAIALIGDAQNIMLDEPLNGLDPHGVAWMRDFIKTLASQGKTVLLSSHLMSELELVADHIVMLNQGHIISDADINDIHISSHTDVEISSKNIAEVSDLLIKHEYRITPKNDRIIVHNADPEELARLIVGHNLSLMSLIPTQTTLEATFMSLTKRQGENA
ncbi:MAG: ATP-binding cassette domain-containing protein [Actinomycetaceae bacterium]|nr:ATP-binding cassette domain-containing protein [Actinomycetaceae bacterium]